MALSTPSRTSEAPPPAGTTARAPEVPVLLVSPDEALWGTLAGRLPGLRLEQFDDVADLVDRWNPARPAVVLLDGRFDEGLSATVQRVQTHAVTLVPVAVVDDASLARATALERQKALHDHLAAEPDPGTARAVIDRAVEEALARAAIVPPGVSPAVRGSPPRRAPPAGPRPLVYAVAGLVVAAAAGAWFLLPREDAPAPAAGVPVAGPASSDAAPSVAAPVPATDAAPGGAAVAEEVERLLAQARDAMRDRRYIDPANDNALDRYRDVLAVDPANGEARQGLERIVEVLVGRAETALGNREYAVALRAIEVARDLKPDHPRLAALDTQASSRVRDLSTGQVQAALQANALDRATGLLRQAERAGSLSPSQLAQFRQELARRESAAATGELARLAQARITQGRLTTPADDSARAYLERLRAAQAPEFAATITRLEREYARRATVEARSSLARGAWSEAEGWIAEVRATGGATAAAPLARELADAQRASATPAPEPARTAEAASAGDAARESAIAAAAVAAAPAAAPVAAGAGTTGSAPTVARLPRLLRPIEPAYPDRAQRMSIEGWVDVGFVVDADGRPQDVRVVDAQPAGTFDAAAVAAVRRARFQPAQAVDGSIVPMNTRLRVRFDLPDSGRGLR